ncbi:LPXTG cell wall anchor domain-containing protein, partial [Eubacteriales bacterium OttesenSCG-928-K08]|nr:LPXTG cell wall anchor domain-containing protein [Eubacteriales bacterium OttesenSCG-928-K08]
GADSQTGGTSSYTGGSGGTPNSGITGSGGIAVNMTSLGSSATEALANAAGGGVVLTAVNLRFNSNGQPITFRMNAAGAVKGETYTGILKNDKGYQTVTVTAVADGVVQFTISESGQFAVIAGSGAEVVDPGVTLPKTGDSSTMIPMVLLLACLALLVVSKRAISR